MEETISLQDIFTILKKHITTILVSLFAGLALAGVVTFFIITPEYSSRAQMVVALPQSDDASRDVNGVNYNLQMLNTYKDIIKEGDALATTVKGRLSSEYNINMSVSEIKDSLEVEQSEESQMFSIVAKSDKSANAEHIANTTAEVFQETVKDVLTNVDKITILSKAVASPTPVSPNNKLNLAIGVVLGLLVGIGLSFVFELMDRTVKDSKFITENLGLTILGNIPEISAKEVAASADQIARSATADRQQNTTASLDGRRRRKRL